MAGIGTTIETDLVGEMLEVWLPQEVGDPRRVARGRCRAATTAPPSGDIRLWLEITDETDASYSWGNGARPAVGDILCVTASNYFGAGFLRLIRS